MTTRIEPNRRITRNGVDFEYRMFVIPVSFNEHGKELLGDFINSLVRVGLMYLM
jgi:hypothetical protein